MERFLWKKNSMKHLDYLIVFSSYNSLRDAQLLYPFYRRRNWGQRDKLAEFMELGNIIPGDVFRVWALSPWVLEDAAVGREHLEGCWTHLSSPVNMGISAGHLTAPGREGENT